MTLDPIRKLSDDQVVSSLDGLSRQQREIGAEIIAHLVVVKERNIHLDMSYSSLAEYCVERLGCSRDVAYKWASAVKVAEAYPEVLGWLAAGDITTSALVALAPHRDDAELVTRSRGKSRRQIQMMCAAKYPDENWNRIQFRVRPVADGLSKIEMTVPDAFLQQIEEALDVDSHLDPSRDRFAVLSRALEAYITTRKRKRQKTTDRPMPPRDEPTKAVPARVVREAYETSGARCTYVSSEGRRCTARAFLELDHIVARARGGANDQIRVYCRNHNQHAADKQLGKKRMRAARHRARVLRAICSTLKEAGFPARVARAAAKGAVRALGPGADMELLQRDALRRAAGSSRASRAPAPRSRSARGARRNRRARRAQA